MYWEVYFGTSVFVSLTVVVSILLLHYGAKKRHKVLTPFNILVVGVFFALVICLLPAFSTGSEGESVSIFEQIPLAIHNTFQAYTNNSDLQATLSKINCENKTFATVYASYVAVLFVIAPVLTFGFVLSLFRDLTAYIKMLFGVFRDTYVFSELNEKSLALGTDIKKKHKRATLVFMDVDNEEVDSGNDLLKEALDLGAICFNKEILRVNFRVCRTKLVFFVIGGDDEKNVQYTINLLKLHKDRKNTELYIFTTGVESELVLCKAEKGEIRVKRINEDRALISRHLYLKGHCLFENARPKKNGDKVISVLLVGLGRHGTEMLKALSWYCQMDGYELEINAFDIDDRAKEKLEASVPDLLSPKYNGVKTSEEAEYTINVFPGVDVTGQSFVDKVMSIDRPTYVFVSLGSDEMNIRISVDLRKVFERMSIHPQPTIQTLVYSSDAKSLLKGIANYKGIPYNIEFIGDMRSFYKESVIMDSKLDNLALAIHKQWKDEEDFWLYDYNYRSSIASAIHKQARIECGIPGADKPEEERTPEEMRVIQVIEHRRWNAYMRSEGYIYGKERNDIAKVHNDLVRYSDQPRFARSEDPKSLSN